MFRVDVREYNECLPDKKYTIGVFKTLEEAEACRDKFINDKGTWACYYRLNIKESYTKVIKKVFWKTVK